MVLKYDQFNKEYSVFKVHLIHIKFLARWTLYLAPSFQFTVDLSEKPRSKLVCKLSPSKILTFIKQNN